MSSQENTDFFDLGDKTSLICADSATTDVAKATLRELGFKCHTAETAELAIERMRYNNYDCIIVHENIRSRTRFEQCRLTGSRGDIGLDRHDLGAGRLAQLVARLFECIAIAPIDDDFAAGSFSQ